MCPIGEKLSLNFGNISSDSLAWFWYDGLKGKYAASGAAPASQVQFVDIDG